ncbi:hypothetical protein [uncultured Aquimarina sp.]|uniref:hypothetical protein n=1 Tax=uncultured Aquimarina sp. TaxID=575652 RepID=UPI00262B609E|nr:hypothetical protein [uncultured Aquimarina sp.]
MSRVYMLLLLFVSFIFLNGCVSQKKFVDLEARNKETKDLLNTATVKLNSAIEERELLNRAYKIPVQQISEADPSDESSIIKNNIICDYEQLIRDNFSEYQLYRKEGNNNEIWFYNYLRRIRNNVFGGDAYLLEIFSINYSNPSQIRCKVKYFDSLEKKIGMLQETNEKGNGINKLRTLIQDCDG